MTDIPTRPVWLVVGRAEENDVRVFERFFSEDDGAKRLSELRNQQPSLSFELTESKSIIPDRQMPTENQVRQLCRLLHYALVGIRNLAHGGDSELIAEFADLLHNLPTEMFDPENWDWNLLEYSLRDFELRHPGKTAFDFSRMVSDIRTQA